MALITVTQEDIDQGTMFETRSCPIARSLRRYLGAEAGDIRVAYEGISVDNFETFAAKTTRSMQRFINDFDRGKPVKPFRFRLTWKKVKV